MPNEDTGSYQDGSKEFRAPFTLYAQCILVPFQGCARDPYLAKPYIENVSKHAESGFNLYITYFNGD